MGSVFSPTYFRARARELAPSATRFCALNVVVYGEHQRHWAFTEHPEHRIGRSRDRFDLGPSHITWEGDELVVHIEERGTEWVRSHPIRGTIRLRPHRRFSSPLALDPQQRHHWWPVAPLAEVEVTMDQPQLRFTGSGYHDTNFGAEPLEHGFSTWDWSRAELPEGTAVFYDARPRHGSPSDRGLLFRPDGEVESFAAPHRHRLPRTRWGIERATRCDHEATTPLVNRTLEDTPARCSKRTLPVAR